LHEAFPIWCRRNAARYACLSWRGRHCRRQGFGADPAGGRPDRREGWRVQQLGQAGRACSYARSGVSRTASGAREDVVTATPLLTERDFAILEAMLKRRRALGDPLAEVIERKLAEAKVVPASEIEGGIATLNSRVAFRVDSLPVEERTLVN